MPKKNLKDQLGALFSDAAIPEAQPEPTPEEPRPTEPPPEPPEVEPAIEPAPEAEPPVEPPPGAAEGIAVHVTVPQPEPPPEVPERVIEVPVAAPEPEIEQPVTRRPGAIDRLSHLLATPVFEDEEKTRVARLLTFVLLVLCAIAAVLFVLQLVLYGFPTAFDEAFMLLGAIIMAPVSVGLLLLTRRGNIRTASALLLSALWGIITFWIWSYAGIAGDNSTFLYIPIIVLASLLLGGRTATTFTMISILAIVGVFFAEVGGVITFAGNQPPTTFDLVIVVTVLVLMGLLMRYAVNSIAEALNRARRNERAQLKANRELQAVRISLEERVADRTRELNRRATHLQAAAEVSRVANSVLQLDALMHQTVNLIRNRFDYHYVGLFLLDPAGHWAVLHAGTGEAGRVMLAARHKLGVGSDSMIGWCIAHNEARIALDVGQDAVRFDNPLLPETRSEMALPLISRGQTIGALTVQSVEPQAFTEEDITVLQTMADQVANAVQNARLFQETERLARRNQLISEISGKLRGALDLETVLQTTVRELGLALDTSEAVIRLGAPAAFTPAKGDGHGDRADRPARPRDPATVEEAK